MTAVMAAEPPGCAQRSVVAGERGLRGRNGAMEAPPEAPPRSGCAALAEEANQLRDVGDGGEAARRVRGDVLAGGRGLRGRTGAMDAPPERGRDQEVQR